MGLARDPYAFYQDRRRRRAEVSNGLQKEKASSRNIIWSQIPLSQILISNIQRPGGFMYTEIARPSGNTMWLLLFQRYNLTGVEDKYLGTQGDKQGETNYIHQQLNEVLR